MKKKSSTDIQTSPPKKSKLTKTTTKKNEKEKSSENTEDQGLKTSSKFSKSKKGNTVNLKSAKPKKFPPKGNKNAKESEKIEDWNKYKKEKKELRLKRIQARTKDNFDKIQQAKKMGEKLRLKTLKEDDRNKIINQLHSLLKGNYAKFVLAHDTARIVQWLLKYSSNIMVQQISQVGILLLYISLIIIYVFL